MKKQIFLFFLTFLLSIFLLSAGASATIIQGGYELFDGDYNIPDDVDGELYGSLIGIDLEAKNDKLNEIFDLFEDPEEYGISSKDDLSKVTKIDQDTGIYTKTYDIGGVNNTFTLTATGFKDGDSGEPIWGTWESSSPLDFLTIKAGTGFSLWDVGGSTSGSWSVAGLETRKGNLPALSHVSVISGGNGGGAQVPEPATIFLLGSGLLGLFGYRKKFWKPKK
jgi:hypothetical protein